MVLSCRRDDMILSGSHDAMNLWYFIGRYPTIALSGRRDDIAMSVRRDTGTF